jgi:ferredoxin-NADP reductase
MPKNNTRKYTVTKTLIEAPGVTTLELSCAEGSPSYIPGQFITVYLPELATPEGKAYSIASASDETLRITVRERGEFSRHLSQLHVGDSFFASAPSGYFYSESNESSLVMIAAGIGIAPFRSMMLDAIRHDPARRLMLFYTNRTTADIVFKKELAELVAAHPNLTVHHFVTREKKIPAGVTQGRMSAEVIVREVGSAPDPEYFICGSIEFIRDLWRELKASDVPEDRLYTEAFYGH